jgi:hypothetical protein
MRTGRPRHVETVALAVLIILYFLLSAVELVLHIHNAHSSEQHQWQQREVL